MTTEIAHSDTKQNVPRLALTIPEAARSIGISVRSLWTKINMKEIPHLRIGRRVVVPVDLLRKWLDEQVNFEEQP